MSPTAKLPCKISTSYIYLLMELGSIGTISSARLVKYETIFNSAVHFECRETQQSTSYCCTRFKNRKAYYAFNELPTKQHQTLNKHIMSETNNMNVIKLCATCATLHYNIKKGKEYKCKFPLCVTKYAFRLLQNLTRYIKHNAN